jgi:flagellar basal body P-ring protein FlgI/flagellar basal body L-ring protein FlgH
MGTPTSIRILFAMRMASMALIVGTAVGGCGLLPARKPKPEPVVARVLPPPTPRTEGAIYQAGQQIELFADLKARRVGDVLTIRLTESTAASKSAVTKTTKTTGVNNTGVTLFGRSPTVGGVGIGTSTLNGADTFDGEGSATQGNTFTGSLTVTVMDVQPNGNLVVQGDKTLKLNQGDEFVHVSGVVRRADIATDNSVTSDRVADAHISYSALLLSAPLAYGERIKDLAQIQGVRTNQLFGYGLVVGLDSTGDQTSQAPFTVQSLNNMLAQLGITVPSTVTPQLKNVAAVAVHAVMPAFVKPGQTIDITVNSIANAKSLRGGSLLVTPLRGMDGQIYAIAQGNLIVSGFGVEGTDGSKLTVNVPSSGRIPNGATVERAVNSQLSQGDSIILNLNDADFTTATRVVASVNKGVGEGVASIIDGGSVRVQAPLDITQRVAFLSTVENLQVEPAAASAPLNNNTP